MGVQEGIIDQFEKSIGQLKKSRERLDKVIEKLLELEEVRARSGSQEDGTDYHLRAPFIFRHLEMTQDIFNRTRMLAKRLEKFCRNLGRF